MARQLAKSPVILLADEPTGTLDRKTAAIIHKIIQNEAKTNDMAVLITSHLPEDIESIADRAILLEDGRITKEGAPKEVIDQFLSTVGEIKKHEVASGDTIVQVAELEKKYVTLDRGVIRAVSNVSFDVQEGEIFGLIGLSGAGKTSVSKIIAGVLEPTNGEVLVRVGDDWVDMTLPGPDNRGRAKPYIGILYQEYDLYPFRDVLDNLTSSIGLELPAELSEHKAVQTLMAAGFSETKSESILAKVPDELSQGERHRVALAQVLIREPNLVILDEPTGTMDPITKKDVSNSILTARTEIGETFMIVSHDLDFVKEVCDRAALMRGGKIISIGPTAQVLDVLTEQRESGYLTDVQQACAQIPLFLTENRLCSIQPFVRCAMRLSIQTPPTTMGSSWASSRAEKRKNSTSSRNMPFTQTKARSELRSMSRADAFGCALINFL